MIKVCIYYEHINQRNQILALLAPVARVSKTYHGKNHSRVYAYVKDLNPPSLRGIIETNKKMRGQRSPL